MQETGQEGQPDKSFRLRPVSGSSLIGKILAEAKDTGFKSHLPV